MAYETLVKANATLGDTINLITDTVNKESVTPFVLNKVAQLNPTGDKYLFMQRLFDDLISNATYKLDPEGKEMVWTSEKIFREKLYDCKKASTYLAAALQAAGIVPILKHVFYDKEDFTHIYVIVPYPDLNNYVTLDPVNNLQFDKEVDFSKGTLFDINGNIIPMDLYKMGRMSGKQRSYNFLDSINTGCNSIDNDLASISGVSLTAAMRDNILNDIIDNSEIRSADTITIAPSLNLNPNLSPAQAIKAYYDSLHNPTGKCCPKLKKLAKKIVSKVKNVGLAIPRGAFLLLLKVNALNLAKKLAAGWKKNPEAIKNMWTKVGGDVNTLKHNIAVGSGTTISGYTMGQGKSMNDILNMHIPTGQTVAASLVTAAPIIAAALALLNSLGIIGEGDEAEDAANAALEGLSGDWQPGGDGIPEDESGSDQHKSGSFGIDNLQDNSISNWVGAAIKGSLLLTPLHMYFGSTVASFVAIGFVAVKIFYIYKSKKISYEF